MYSKKSDRGPPKGGYSLLFLILLVIQVGCLPLDEEISREGDSSLGEAAIVVEKTAQAASRLLEARKEARHLQEASNVEEHHLLDLFEISDQDLHLLKADHSHLLDFEMDHVQENHHQAKENPHKSTQIHSYSGTDPTVHRKTHKGGQTALKSEANKKHFQTASVDTGATADSAASADAGGSLNITDIDLTSTESIWTKIQEIVKRFWYICMAIIIVIILISYCAAIVHFFQFFRSFYWMAKANDYQQFPEDRLKKQTISEKEDKFWNAIELRRPVHGFEHVYNKYFSTKRISNISYSEFYFEVSMDYIDVNQGLNGPTFMTWFMPLALNYYKKMEAKSKDPWFYFEVEISNLDINSDIAVGLMEWPEPNTNTTPLQRDVDNARKFPYDKGFFDFKPGDYENSFGFYLKSGTVITSNSSSLHTFAMDELINKMNNPKRLFQMENDSESDFGLDESEDYLYQGDCIGVAYNGITGQIFLTFNGTLINAPHPKITTEINLQLFLKKLEEKEIEDFDHDEEMELFEDDPEAYIKQIDLDRKYMKGLKESPDFKITPGLKYMPVVYTSPGTKFLFNMGRSAFRNGQPEFKKGLIVPLHDEYHRYLGQKPVEYWKSDFVDDDSEMFDFENEKKVDKDGKEVEVDEDSEDFLKNQ